MQKLWEFVKTPTTFATDPRFLPPVPELANNYNQVTMIIHRTLDERKARCLLSELKVQTGKLGEILGKVFQNIEEDACDDAQDTPGRRTTRSNSHGLGLIDALLKQSDSYEEIDLEFRALYKWRKKKGKRIKDR